MGEVTCSVILCGGSLCFFLAKYIVIWVTQSLKINELLGMHSTSSKHAYATRWRQPLPGKRGRNALWPFGREKKRQCAAGPKQDQWQIEELVALFPEQQLPKLERYHWRCGFAKLRKPAAHLPLFSSEPPCVLISSSLLRCIVRVVRGELLRPGGTAECLHQSIKRAVSSPGEGAEGEMALSKGPRTGSLRVCGPLSLY